MIIGNKCDLSDSRVISKEDGESIADQYGYVFMETSAKNGMNVKKVRILLLGEMAFPHFLLLLSLP